MNGVSLSVAEAERIDREMDEALALLLEAGDRGVVCLERVPGRPRSENVYPFGQRFCDTLDALIRFGLVEITTPDRRYSPSGPKIGERAVLTAQGRAKAIEVVPLPEEGVQR